MTIDMASDLAMALDPSMVMEAVGTPADPWQRTTLTERTQNVLLNCSRQSGKSTTVAAKAVWTALYVPGSLSLCVSPSLRQSGELYDKIGETYKRVGAPIAVDSESAVRVKLANGSRVVSLPGTEATVRGYSAPSLVLVDEAARVSTEMITALRPMLAVSKGQLILMSTPFGRRGFFYEAWAGTEPWLRLKVPATDCPRIDPNWLDEQRLGMSDWEFRQEYLCSFESNAAAFFDDALIDAAVDHGLEAFGVE